MALRWLGWFVGLVGLELFEGTSVAWLPPSQENNKSYYFGSLLKFSAKAPAPHPTPIKIISHSIPPIKIMSHIIFWLPPPHPENN